MSDFLAINPLGISFVEAPKFPFSNLRPRNELKPNFHAPLCAKLSNSSNLYPANDNNGGSKFVKGASAAQSSRVNGISDMLGSRDYCFFNELNFKDKGGNNFGQERTRVDGDAANLHMNSEMQKDIGSRVRTPADGLSLKDDTTASSGLEDFFEFHSDLVDDKGSRMSENGLREEDLVRIQSDADGVDLRKDERFEKYSGKLGSRRGKQIIRRSNLLAKQVVSIRSALSLGFVSQLWVDTTSWMVLFVEVRSNLLSGDSERFLLEDISQVGDVVLVQDESVMENELKMVGLETLVGYKVLTPSRQNIGKVRGYTFCINSGTVEALELDSFGLSIIPSSLVSTYSLLVEDVLEVVSAAVVVHEDAASRIQRLSKGFLGNQSVGISVDDVEVEEYSDSERSATSGYVSRTRRRFRRKKPNQRDWDSDEDLELPMDYL